MANTGTIDSVVESATATPVIGGAARLRLAWFAPARMKPLPRWFSSACLSLCLFGCADTPAQVVDNFDPEVLDVVEVATGLSRPLYVTAPPGDPRLFVVEQDGRIRIFGGPSGNPFGGETFLDLSGRVSGGNEQGLLGLAFHPDYSSNGRFFVNYTDLAGTTRVERFQVGSDPNVADPSSGEPILSINQPFANHNGGHLVFGSDGMLYVGSGDGGSGGDPRGHGQNHTSLLGTILRLDVDGGTPYGVPPDNPFAGGPGGEVWAFGLRNPWRFSFDRVDEMLYVGDVGQGEWEEVNAVPSHLAGVNYGWNVLEGEECFRSSSCDRSGLTGPALVYGHGDGCSVTGGVVYRGDDVASLRGRYLYADFCSGWVRSFRLDGGEAVDPLQLPLGDLGQITSFGEDSRSEVYIVSRSGTVYRIVEGD